MNDNLLFLDQRRLDGIGLDELVQRAALQTRVDRKYLLSSTDADLVLAALADREPDARVLEMDGERTFGYESVYFDTPDLLSYRLAATARRRRFKLRTRSYLDSGDTYLELKTRGSRSATVKDRIPYELDQRAALTADAREYAEIGIAGIGIPEPARLQLRPTLRTSYRRTTIFQPSTSSRATVDTELAWESDGGEVLTRPGLVIIETKSGCSTSSADRVLWAHGVRPATVSKYGTGLAAMRGLPANKWNRVLRRYFDDAATPSMPRAAYSPRVAASASNTDPAASAA